MYSKILPFLSDYAAIKDLTLRKKTVLHDVVAFYSQNPEVLRAYIVGIGCVYNPTGTSPGCAIGRLVGDEKGTWIQSRLPNKQISDLIGTDSEKYLPEYMLELGEGFWEEVQKLHDNSELWDFGAGGLSWEGYSRLYQIYADVNSGKS